MNILDEILDPIIAEGEKLKDPNIDKYDHIKYGCRSSIARQIKEQLKLRLKKLVEENSDTDDYGRYYINRESRYFLEDITGEQI